MNTSKSATPFRGQDVYWMDGQRGAMPPAELTNCDPGFYKDR